MTDVRQSPTGQLLTIDSAGVVNDTTFPGATLDDVLQPPDNYLSLTEIGDGAPGTVNLTLPGQIPAGNFVWVMLEGSGGSGGSGAGSVSAVNSARGGSAGGGAARMLKKYPRNFLLSRLPIAVVLPAGGAAVAGQNFTVGPTVNGVDGQNGAAATFVRANPRARLVLTELIQNAVEHAFVARGGTVTVELKREAGVLRLRVSDDGGGLPEGFSLDTGSHLGLQIVRTLISELRGSIEIDADQGTTVVLTIPLDRRHTIRLFGLRSLDQRLLFDQAYKYDPALAPARRVEGTLASVHVQRIANPDAANPLTVDFRLGHFAREFARGTLTEPPDYLGFGVFTGERFTFVGEDLARARDTALARDPIAGFSPPGLSERTPWGVPGFFLGAGPRGEITWNRFREIRAQLDVDVGAGQDVDVYVGGEMSRQRVEAFQRVQAHLPVGGAVPPVSASAFSPFANTATRSDLPVPFGRVTTPRTFWSEWRGSMPRFIAISIVSSNFALAPALISFTASSTP